jgi:hypothetical protein
VFTRGIIFQESGENDHNTLIREETWMNDSPLFVQFPRLYNITFFQEDKCEKSERIRFGLHLIQLKLCMGRYCGSVEILKHMVDDEPNE